MIEAGVRTDGETAISFRKFRVLSPDLPVSCPLNTGYFVDRTLGGVRIRSAGLIQQFPQLVRQRGRRKRLLQKRQTFIQHALMDDGIFGVSGGEKDFGVGI